MSAFLEYAGEPAALKRQGLGVWGVLFLAFFTFLAWLLKKEYGRDVKWFLQVTGGPLRAVAAGLRPWRAGAACAWGWLGGTGRPSAIRGRRRCGRRIPVVGEAHDGCESAYAKCTDPVFVRRRCPLPPRPPGARGQGRDLRPDPGRSAEAARGPDRPQPVPLGADPGRARPGAVRGQRGQRIPRRTLSAPAADAGGSAVPRPPAPGDVAPGA